MYTYLDLEPSRSNQINMTYTTDITIRTGQFRNSSFRDALMKKKKR